MVFVRKLPLFLLFYTAAHSKTIRSKIYTTKNGTKELSFVNKNEVNQRDIDFLLKNLNEMNMTTELATEPPPSVDANDKELKESILMQHWNSLTEVGWKNYSKPIKKMYLNSTRILRLAPEFKEEKEKALEEGEHVKDRLNVTETAGGKLLADSEKSSMFHLCRSITALCQDSQQINREKLIGCLTLKNKTLLEMVEEKLRNGAFHCEEMQNAAGTEEEVIEATIESPRTLLRPRRLLQKVLLPLLVILVIKYLVTLPFVALSVFTLNAMWLGLLSIGAVIFAKFRGHDYFSQKVSNRRYAHFPGGEVYEVGSPLTNSDVIWSPVRVPLAHTSIGAHTHLQ